MDNAFSSIQNDAPFQAQIDYAVAHDRAAAIAEAPKAAPVQKPSRTLDQIPELELEGRLELLKAKLVIINNVKQTPKSQKVKDKLTNAIASIEAELVNRKSTSDNPTITNSPEKVVAKVQNVGTNVGLGALLIGVVGYMVGSHYEKNAWAFAIGGAVVGGAGAYWITKYKQGKENTDTAPKLVPKTN